MTSDVTYQFRRFTSTCTAYPFDASYALKMRDLNCSERHRNDRLWTLVYGTVQASTGRNRIYIHHDLRCNGKISLNDGILIMKHE